MLRHYLQWHITHRCNLSCIHCYQDDRDKVMNYEEMISALDKYEQYIKNHNYEGQINLTGGEPLLHPDFFRLAEEIRKRGIRLGILTNGTLIDALVAARLAELTPVFVQISIDGNREIHDLIRGEGNFDLAWKGIDYLKKNKIRVLVSFTAMKANIDSFEELASFCRKHRVDKLWWDRVVSGDEKLFLSTEEFKSMSEKALKLKKKYKFISCDRALQGLPENSCGYQCSAGKRLLVILANGDLMACRRLPFMVGNINDIVSLEELKNNRIFESLSKPDFPKECRKCVHLRQCRGGAKCVTYAQMGKLGIKDINCYL